MTIEEIIKRGNEKFPQDIIEIINDDGSITREDVNFKLRKAYIEGLIDNNISLPSNLDEAAEKTSQSAYSEPTADGFAKRSFFKRGFKAGAEWMAGQGQTFEAHVDNGCAIASGVELPFVLWDTYEDGDVLKVQLRKINEKEE